MKLKIFSMAILLIAGIMVNSVTSFAQQSSTTHGTDTAYAKKMQNQQLQMRQLQKQMAELQTESGTKRQADATERNAEREKRNVDNAKRMNERIAENVNRAAERMAENAKQMTERMAKTFSNFGSNFRFNFNGSDSVMEARVKRGEAKEKTKAFSKTYTINASDKLMIDNRYGKVIVNTWDKNEFKVDVQIKAYANDDANAQKLLDKTTIADSKEGDAVGFKTTIEPENDNGNSFWGIMTNNGKTTVRQMVINYTVYMPAKNALDINNRYGGIELPNMDGKVTIDNAYGGLLAKALTNNENKVSVRYGSAKIGSFTGGDLNVSYGNLSLDAADKLNATIRYGGAKIGKLSTSGTINLHYGNGLDLLEMDKNLKSLTVNSSYSGVQLSGIAAINADFDVTVRYASFLYDNNAISITSKTPDNQRGNTSTKNYKGHLGKGNPEKVISINSSYGSVKFK